jgi:AcrR family transcriptional regulator
VLTDIPKSSLVTRRAKAALSKAAARTPIAKLTRGKSAKKVVRTNAELTAATTGNILRATIDWLAQSGYAGTTLTMIAAQVGVSRTALLYHFRSKDELMVAAISRIFEDLQAYYHRDVNHSATIAERVLAILEKSYLWTQSPDHTALMELSLAARRSSSLGALVNEALHHHNNQFDVEWDALLTSAGIAKARSGLIRDFGISTLRGLAVSQLLVGNKKSIKRQMAMLTGIVLDEINASLAAGRAAR